MILAINYIDKQKFFRKKSKDGVIYKITNLINGDFYIGSSTNLYKRYYTHLNHMRTSRKTCVKLNRAVQKHGEENFKFEIIARCPVEYVLKLEQWFLINLNPKYNIAKIAGSNLGVKRSEEVRAKRSLIQKENWKNDDYKKHHLEKLSSNWKKGSAHHGAKINDDVVRQIKTLLSEGFTCKDVATRLTVSHHTVKDIKRNKTWKHVTL